MPLRIFFSHAWADKAGAIVKKLMNELRQNDNYDVWLDRYEMDLGEHIDNTIAKNIAQCDVVIVAWSKNASTNKHVHDELQWACQYRKPIVPCIIDGHPTDESELLQGLKWIELKGNDRHDIPQLAFLKNFLIDLQMRQLETSATSPEVKKELEELRKKQQATSNLLKELEDIHYRQKIGASGNDSGDVYVQSALHEAIKLTGLSFNEKQQEFFKRMLEVSKQFPGAEHNDRKVQYLMQILHELDPDRTDKAWQEFVQSALGMFGMMQSNETLEAKRSAVNESSVTQQDESVPDGSSPGFWSN